MDDYSNANADANIVYVKRDEWEAQGKRIAELEQEATEYLAANKKAERIIAELQAQLAQVRAGAQAHVQEWQDKANALQQERDALEKKLNFMIEAVFCDAHVFEANQMAQDKCPLCERDAARQSRARLVSLIYAVASQIDMFSSQSLFRIAQTQEGALYSAWAEQDKQKQRADEAAQDARELAFCYNQLYITSDLGGWRGEILERLGNAYQIACRHLKDAETNAR